MRLIRRPTSSTRELDEVTEELLADLPEIPVPHEPEAEGGSKRRSGWASHSYTSWKASRRWDGTR